MTVPENQTFEHLARDDLAALGLAFRLPDGTHLQQDIWREIDGLAQRVIDAVSFQEPDIKGPWLRIDKLPTRPNAGGWLSFKATPSPYWIPKLDLPRLRDLEHYLDTVMADQPVQT